MPPCTSTLSAASAASLARNFVAKLSEPSTTTSARPTRSAALASSKRRSIASTWSHEQRRAAEPARADDERRLVRQGIAHPVGLLPSRRDLNRGGAAPPATVACV